MVSLIDIGALQRTVELRGQSVPIFPISIKSLIMLIDRFPVLREMLAQRKISVTAEELMKLTPEVLGAIIAVGIGHPGDAKQEEAAQALGMGEQGEIIAKIAEITFPRGLGPFVEVADRLGIGVFGGTGKEQVTTSPNPSKSASPTGTVNGSGTTVPDNSPPSSNSQTEPTSQTAQT